MGKTVFQFKRYHLTCIPDDWECYVIGYASAEHRISTPYLEIGDILAFPNRQSAEYFMREYYDTQIEGLRIKPLKRAMSEIKSNVPDDGMIRVLDGIGYSGAPSRVYLHTETADTGTSTKLYNAEPVYIEFDEK